MCGRMANGTPTIGRDAAYCTAVTARLLTALGRTRTKKNKTSELLAAWLPLSAISQPESCRSLRTWTSLLLAVLFWAIFSASATARVKSVPKGMTWIELTA